ncbi:MAG: LytR C-terminal domain-containing protein [Actinobacteria bacterium]|nr:LytR C-terminal domain-containing protein [Actinomycetota bacterium]
MAKHTPPDDNSFSLSLLRHLAAAVALVAVVAAAFWGVGQVQDDLGTMAAAPDGTTTQDAPATDPAAPSVPASEAPPADEGTTPTEAATAPEEDLTATPTEDEPVADGTGEDSSGADAGALDPADISVQVLDATGEGGAAGDEVAEQLTQDGFNVVATNQAVRVYEVTTVFYTPGNEAKAEQLAAMYGYDAVEPEPGNLSHSVDVHLVVGTDA